MLGRRIRGRVPIPLTLNELQHTLLEEWDLTPQENIRHLISGMPRRMQAIIRARGGLTSINTVTNNGYVIEEDKAKYVF
nr:unnamed protein product [Callosobruchus chinensis]